MQFRQNMDWQMQTLRTHAFFLLQSEHTSFWDLDDDDMDGRVVSSGERNGGPWKKKRAKIFPAVFRAAGG